jgi:hypothetical protein
VREQHDHPIGNGFYVDAARVESAKQHMGVVQIFQDDVDIRVLDGGD